MLRRMVVLLLVGVATFVLVVMFVIKNDALSDDSKHIAFALYFVALALFGNWYVLFSNRK